MWLPWEVALLREVSGEVRTPGCTPPCRVLGTSLVARLSSRSSIWISGAGLGFGGHWEPVVHALGIFWGRGPECLPAGQDPCFDASAPPSPSGFHFPPGTYAGSQSCCLIPWISPAEITENVSKAQGMGGKAPAFHEESQVAGWELPGTGSAWITAGCKPHLAGGGPKSGLVISSRICFRLWSTPGASWGAGWTCGGGRGFSTFCPLLP